MSHLFFYCVLAVLLGASLARPENSPDLPEQIFGEFTNTCKDNSTLTQAYTEYESCTHAVNNVVATNDQHASINRFCMQTKIAVNCLINLYVAVKPCMEDKFLAFASSSGNISIQVQNFMCHTNGEQMVLFEADKGPECLTSKYDSLSKCTADIVGDLLLFKRECSDIKSLLMCIDQELETCTNQTPAIKFKSIGNIVLNQRQCNSEN